MSRPDPAGSLSRSLATLLALVLGSVPLAAGGLAGAARAQAAAGCQLVDGTLQCVPGLSADPQTQIRILEGEIQRGQQLEGAMEQRIEGLQSLVLAGNALEGSLLRAQPRLTGSGPLPPAATTYHWYRHSPGSDRWQLIPGATGPTYVPQAEDVDQFLLVVVVVSRPDGVRRVSSAPVGPVRPAVTRLRLPSP